MPPRDYFDYYLKNREDILAYNKAQRDKMQELRKTCNALREMERTRRHNSLLRKKQRINTAILEALPEDQKVIITKLLNETLLKTLTEKQMRDFIRLSLEDAHPKGDTDSTSTPTKKETRSASKGKAA
jgi:hypothetical protein